jgi:NAD(P)-dependent dehydrogenase (short-subunit alcohol dehydrogenase family)
MNLKEQVALVTGGSRGLGKAFALALAAKSARVAVTARSEDELKATAQKITDAGGQAVAIPADVTDEAAVTLVITKVEQTFGPITLLVNNAGQFRAFGTVDNVDSDSWWREVEINVRGPFLYAQGVLPKMRARRKGRIINVVSAAGLQGLPTVSAYSVSKTALLRLTEILAMETAQDGIQVFALHPGTVRTSMSSYAHDTPEVGERAPQVQQWFQQLFAEGADTPIERSVNLILKLAAGEGDVLSGCYMDVDADLGAMVKERSSNPHSDTYTLRLKE